MRNGKWFVRFCDFLLSLDRLDAPSPLSPFSPFSTSPSLRSPLPRPLLYSPSRHADEQIDMLALGPDCSISDDAVISFPATALVLGATSSVAWQSGILLYR